MLKLTSEAEEQLWAQSMHAALHRAGVDQAAEQADRAVLLFRMRARTAPERFEEIRARANEMEGFLSAGMRRLGEQFRAQERAERAEAEAQEARDKERAAGEPPMRGDGALIGDPPPDDAPPLDDVDAPQTGAQGAQSAAQSRKRKA